MQHAALQNWGEAVRMNRYSFSSYFHNYNSHLIFSKLLSACCVIVDLFFCLKLLLVLRGNIYYLEIGTKTVIWRVNSVAKCLKIGLFKWGFEAFLLLKVEHRIWKLNWDFLLTRIILRRRGLKIANLSALEEMTKDVRCREEWDF